MKIIELFEATLSESAGDDMLKHAKAMKRDGNLSGYHKQMVKYSEHMADTESFNARNHGKLSPQGKSAAARIKKFEKAAAEHKAAYRAEMDKSKALNEAHPSDPGTAAEVKVIKHTLRGAEKTLDYDAQYKEYDVNAFDKCVEWLAQGTDAEGSKQAAEDIADLLVDAGITGWTVKVIGRDYAQGDRKNWKWQTATTD